MQIGQRITITPEKFKHLAKYSGLVITYGDQYIKYMLYYDPAQDGYVSSIENLYHLNSPGTPLQHSWHRMRSGRHFEVYKINPTTLKHLH